MDKLNQRSNCFSFVLNDSGANCFKSSQFIVNKFRCCDDISVIYIACIKHDRDTDEVGNVKTTHYHVVLQLSAICRLSTILNLIVKLFVCNENQISIEKATSLVMCTRYLIHLDDFDKYQYSEHDIVSNDYDFVFKSMKYIKSVSDMDDLIVIVKEYKNLLELMSVLGYDNYKRYRIVIADIRRELKYQV